MKKRILFLISNMESGGVSKSMTSLLNVLDYKRYDITLWIGNPTGVFMKLIPEDVHVISDTRIAALIDGYNGLWQLIKNGHLLIAMGSFIRMLLSKINRSAAGRLLAWLMPAITPEEYDLIVDYNGQHQLYYMVNKLKGKKKITFFHNDYNKWPYYKNADSRYFPKVDGIFTISQVCLESLKSNFPDCAHKMGVIENVSVPRILRQLAAHSIEMPWPADCDCRLLSVGHVCRRKGTHWAIEAAAILREHGIRFHWFFVGNDSASNQFKEMAKTLNVSDYITFIGVTHNPYPYMASADIIVHPSKFEGKSITLDEAKILAKPIVVTNFSTVSDQFEHRINATICDMTPEAIANAIMELYQSPGLRSQYTGYLQSHLINNTETVLRRFEEIINN